MRIYRREAFLALPPGTVYCKGIPMAFGRIEIKGKSLPTPGGIGDFTCRDLSDIAATGSGERDDRLDQMLDLDASYPLSGEYSRDGFFDPDEIFLVYEPEDVRTLIGWLDEAARAV